MDPQDLLMVALRATMAIERLTAGEPTPLVRDGIEQAEGESEQISGVGEGATATATVKLKWDDLSESEVEFSLKQENGLWKLETVGLGG